MMITISLYILEVSLHRRLYEVIFFRSATNKIIHFLFKKYLSVISAVSEIQSFALSDSQAFGSTNAGIHSGAVVFLSAIF